MRHSLVRGPELAAFTRGGGSVYHQAEWACAVEEGLGYRCFGVLSEERAPVALVVWFETRRGPVRLAGSPLRGCFTPYQRPIWLQEMDPDGRREVLRGQLSFVKSIGYGLIEWILPEADDIAAGLAAATAGSIEAVPTLLLDIEPSEDAMWNRMESRGRNMVRKAERAGVTVRQCAGTEDEVGEYYRMLEGTFAKSGLRPPHPARFYRALARHLIPADRLLFLSAEVDGKTLAMAMFVHDEREMFFTSGTSLPDVSAYAPNNLLQWRAIQFAVRRGLRRYDVGGTGRPSIDRFKASLGGVPHAYTRLTWQSRLMRVAAATYLRARPSLERARFVLSRLRAAAHDPA